MVTETFYKKLKNHVPQISNFGIKSLDLLIAATNSQENTAQADRNFLDTVDNFSHHFGYFGDDRLQEILKELSQQFPTTDAETLHRNLIRATNAWRRSPYTRQLLAMLTYEIEYSGKNPSSIQTMIDREISNKKFQINNLQSEIIALEKLRSTLVQEDDLEP